MCQELQIFAVVYRVSTS